jgi:predicted MFS family arabinose efflux permease
LSGDGLAGDRLPFMPLPASLFFVAAAFLTEGSMMCVFLAQPILALDRWNASPEQLGLLGLLAGGGYGLMALLAGRALGRGLPARPAMLVGLGSQALFALAEPRCATLPGFIALIAVQMLLLGFFWTSFQKTLAESFPPDALAPALSRFNIGWSSGAALGVWISGRLYERIGPSAPFVAGACGLAAAWSIVALTRPRPPAAAGNAAAPEPPRGDATAFVHRAWTMLWISSFVAGILINLFPLLARAKPFAIGPSGISTLHALRQGAMIAAFLAAGATAHWRFRRYPLHLCTGLVVAGLAVIGLAQSAAWLALPFVAFGLAQGMAFALSVYYSLYHPETRAAHVGVHEAMLATAIALGPVLGGKLDAATGQPRAPYWACLAAGMIFWIVLAAFDARRRTAG